MTTAHLPASPIGLPSSDTLDLTLLRARAADADDRLFRAIESFRAAVAKWRAALQHLESVEKKLDGERPPKPNSLFVSASDIEALSAFTGRDPSWVGKEIPLLWIVKMTERRMTRDVLVAVNADAAEPHYVLRQEPDLRAQARADEITAAQRAIEAAEDVKEKELGLHEAWEQVSITSNQRDEAMDVLIAIPATSSSAIRAKANVFMDWMEFGGGDGGLLADPSNREVAFLLSIARSAAGSQA